MFNSVHQLISVPSDEVYFVGNGGPDHAVVLHMSLKVTRYTFELGLIKIKISILPVALTSGTFAKFRR